MTDRIFNFSAGPAVLPESVLERAQGALWSLGDSGIGICEHSHRSPEFDDIIDSAEANIRELAGIGDAYDILFLQGGASSQFFMAPMNFLGADQTADFINTGIWSKKAIAEAKRFGTVHEAASSAGAEFTNIPASLQSSDSPVYLHYTSNNTIFGTQFHYVPKPKADTQLFCDASSDIFSRPIDIDSHGLIYAGAQKNLGPSGLTLVIIKKSLVESGNADLPTMLQYRTHADKGSRFNTPPTFGIYVLGEVVRWLLDFGGLPAIAAYNTKKATLLYDHLDDSKLFRANIEDKGSRSQMNITFSTSSNELDAQFINEAKEAGLSGLKGHRSVGGMRASLYNAIPRRATGALIEFMKGFEVRNG